MGWHYGKRWIRKGGLSLSWVHDNGSEIYQGRPDPKNQKYFIYQLHKPDGSIQNFRLLLDAKRAVSEGEK